MNTRYSRDDSRGYENTIRIYKELFGVIPPYSWWPRTFDGHAGHPYNSHSRREVLLRDSVHEITAANIRSGIEDSTIFGIFYYHSEAVDNFV